MSHMVEHPGCPNGCRKAWRVYLFNPRPSITDPNWKATPDVWSVECKECGYNA